MELSDFQRLVASSVGKVLPIYGLNLFTNPPSTFAPVNSIPVTPNYVIGPGDELLIRIWGQILLDGHFTVDRSGAVYIPQVGQVQVAGISFDKITDYLRAQIGRNFKNFDVNVNMGQLRSIDVFVVGEAKKPGSYTVSSLSTLVNAVFSSGGPTPGGSLRNIQLKRGQQVVTTFDFYDLLIKGDKSRDVQLLTGDVIYIPPAGPMVAIAGSIPKPALYELKDETTVQDVLAVAGGLATLARHRDLHLERIREADDTRSVLDINLDKTGLSTPLADGDILEITPVLDRFSSAVTLRGNVADPRRFAWVPGMRVRDLIPNKEALLTRDFWDQRNRLGLPILDSTPDVRRYAPDAPVAQVNGEGVAPSLSALALSLPNSHDSDRNVYGYSGTNERPAADATEPSRAGLVTSRTNASASAQDRNTSAGDKSAPPSGAGSAGASTSISTAVVGAVQRFPVKNSVVLNAPEIDWAYAVIQRLDKNDLSSELIPFDLGKAVLDGDPSQNLELEPGDVVTVFSKADIKVPQGQQTKFVRLEGEVAASGIYRVKPGENLRQLVARAGGLTSSAYLYGSQFTRESARALQQQRLTEYANDLDQRVKFAEANAANTALNPQDQIADIAALQKVRSVAADLREAKATGRIVLYIRPDSSSLNDIPELPLEDGDTFTVPQVPLSIGVYGSVYTQNLFLYDSHKRADDYIHLAGGGTRIADVARSYIVRADGSIKSRQFSTVLYTRNFSDTHLYPGDSVVVPAQVDKRPLLRNLVDIATIVGQFGLGVAAINVLK
jgi:protein involved in polysaccharide export with SLBB domain